VGPACLQQLAAQLLAVCRNPTQPGFNHYLFESLAALVRWVGAGEAGNGTCRRAGTKSRQKSRQDGQLGGQHDTSL
jgi:hypothetical protein